MVHYDPEELAASPSVPALCPKCGSHRTVVVGRSNDSKTVTIRCGACGERSQVPLDTRTYGPAVA